MTSDTLVFGDQDLGTRSDAPEVGPKAADKADDRAERLNTRAKDEEVAPEEFMVRGMQGYRKKIQELDKELQKANDEFQEWIRCLLKINWEYKGLFDKQIEEKSKELAGARKVIRNLKILLAGSVLINLGLFVVGYL